ncbi:MAG: hypothetical protein ACE149_08045 [Armatimonadota bacterium]
MSQVKDDEPLLPPWVFAIAKIIVPILGLMLLAWVVNKLGLPPKIVTPVLLLLALFGLVYFGGRYYKPFRVEKKTGRCTAKTAADRKSCRKYLPGARLGGGCGRLREDRRCRYVKG